ncbi:hypothetical protein GCM10027612_11060 [Microbispora bryophytorum subsp. camponoti]
MHDGPHLVNVVQPMAPAEFEELVVGPDIGDEMLGDVGQARAHHLNRFVDRAAKLHRDREVMSAGGVDRHVDRHGTILGHVHNANAVAQQHVWFVAAQPPIAQYECTVVLEDEPLMGKLTGQAGDRTMRFAQESLLDDRVKGDLADHGVAHGRFPMVLRESAAGLRKIRSSDMSSSSRSSSVLREMA